MSKRISVILYPKTCLAPAGKYLGIKDCLYAIILITKIGKQKEKKKHHKLTS